MQRSRPRPAPSATLSAITPSTLRVRRTRRETPAAHPRRPVAARLFDALLRRPERGDDRG